MSYVHNTYTSKYVLPQNMRIPQKSNTSKYAMPMDLIYTYINIYDTHTNHHTCMIYAPHEVHVLYTKHLKICDAHGFAIHIYHKIRHTYNSSYMHHICDTWRICVIYQTPQSMRCPWICTAGRCPLPQPSTTL